MKKNLSIKIISLLFAIGMWFYIIQVQNPEVEKTIKNVPVIFSQNQELQAKDLMLVNDREYTVDIRIRGQRKILSELDAGEITVSADVGRIDATGTHSVYTSVAVPYGNVEVVRQTPSTIHITVDEIVEVKKPVLVETVGLPKSGHTVGTTKTTPEEITLRGAKSIVGGVDHVLATVSVSGQGQDISSVEELELISSSGNVITSPYIKCSAETVDLHCEILKTKTVELLPVFSQEVSSLNYTLDENSLKSIQIAGTVSAIEDLESISTEVIASDMIQKDGKVEVKPILPEGVICMDGEKLTLKLTKQ